MSRSASLNWVLMSTVALALFHVFGYTGNLLSPTVGDALRFGLLVPLSAATVSQTWDIIDWAVLSLVSWTAAVTVASGQLTWGVAFALTSTFVVFRLGRVATSVMLLRVGLVCFCSLTVLFTMASLAKPEYDVFGRALFFTGGKNTLALIALPIVFIVARWWSPTWWAGRMTKAMVLLSAVAFPFLGGSGTGKIVTVLLLVAFLAPPLPHRWLPWFAGLIAFNVAVVSGWLLASSRVATDIVVNALAKSPDFTARSRIWEVSWSEVRVDALGQGRGHTILEERILGISESHNSILEVLLTSGVIGLAIFLSLITLALRRSAVSDALGFRLVGIAMLVGVVESYVNHLGFWLLLGAICGSLRSLAGPTQVVTSSPAEVEHAK